MSGLRAKIVFLSHRNNFFEQVMYDIGISIYLIKKMNVQSVVYFVYKISAMPYKKSTQEINEVLLADFVCTFVSFRKCHFYFSFHSDYYGSFP